MTTPVSCDVFKTEKQQESATNIVLNKMTELFMDGVLRPGDLIPPENDLAKSMNVGRGSVREAMKILDAFGIIEIKRGSGTYVCEEIQPQSFNPLLFALLFESKNDDHIVELRQCIEFELVKLIICHAEPSDFERLHQILDAMDQQTDPGQQEQDSMFRHEQEFHHALGKATHNPLISKIYDFIMEFFTPFIRIDVDQTELRAKEDAHGLCQKSISVHRKILNALETKNIGAAEYAVMEGLLIWRERFPKNIMLDRIK